MTSSSTLTVARRSLGHFAVGRLVSAVVGVCTLLLLVRVLNLSDYGLYIALLAASEIVQLAASPGAFAVVFRYLPELRAHNATLELRRLVLGLNAYRVLTLGLVAAIAAIGSDFLARLLGVPAQAHAIQIYALILLFEGVARFIDSQFESLLLQGLAQLSALARNSAKLLALLAVSGAGASEAPLLTWLQLEALTTGAGVLFSCFLMVKHLRQLPAPTQQAAVELPLSRLRRFALPTYISQVIYMASGTEMVKLLVTRLLGTVATAAFGFGALLAATLQRYLPSFLLVGWIRPLLISARENGQPNATIAALAATVLKLNVLMLAPILSLVAVAGPELVHVLAGGRLPESLPYLAYFLVLLAFQSLRAVVSLLGVTLELGNASLQATLWSVLGLAGGLALFQVLGIWALCVGLLVAELLWSLVMVRALARQGLEFGLPLASAGKCLLSAAAAALVLKSALMWLAPDAGTMLTLGAGLLAGLLCLWLASVLRPFVQDERDLINRLLPRRLFVW
jgi:O-antigen/teichoic acid export membrane protein